MPAKKKDVAVAEPVAEKKPAAKKAAGKKTARADEDEVTAPITPTTAAKKLRRESSTGGACTLMPATKDLVDLSQDETEKGTEPFDYAACLTANNSKVFPAQTHYKIITWNVAGLRALLKNGYEKSELKQLISEEQPDVLCLQETKLSDATEAAGIGVIPEYTFFESLSTAKLGYAGTRTYVKNGVFDLEKSKHFKGFDLLKNPNVVDTEGRIVTSFLCPAASGAQPITIINNYVPNSGMKLERLDFRVADYDVLMRNFLIKDVPSMEKFFYGGTTASQTVWLGDLNVAERDYDRFHNGKYKTMQQSPGFTPPERASFRVTLKAADLVDTFRHFYPTARGAYTFYSRMFNQRSKGNGWRLDYFAVAASMIATKRVAGTSILQKYSGSDHIPSVLYLKK